MSTMMAIVYCRNQRRTLGIFADNLVSLAVERVSHEFERPIKDHSTLSGLVGIEVGVMSDEPGPIGSILASAGLSFNLT